MRRFIKPAIALAAAAGAAFAVTSSGGSSPIAPKPAANSSIIEVCEEEQPDAELVELPTLPEIALPEIQLPEIALPEDFELPCIDLSGLDPESLPDLNEILGGVEEQIYEVLSGIEVELPDLEDLLPDFEEPPVDETGVLDPVYFGENEAR